MKGERLASTWPMNPKAMFTSRPSWTPTNWGSCAALSPPTTRHGKTALQRDRRTLRHHHRYPPEDWPTFERRLRASRGEGEPSTSLPALSPSEIARLSTLNRPTLVSLNLTNNRRWHLTKTLSTSRSPFPPFSMQSPFR